MPDKPPSPPQPALDEFQDEMPFLANLSPAVATSLTTVADLEREAAETIPEASATEDIGTEDLPPAVGSGLVKLQLFGRPDEDLARLARTHFEKMEVNSYFPRPLPSQMELEKLLDDFSQDLRDTRNAINHVRMLVAQKLVSRRKLEQALNRRGHYVQAESRGDPSAILSAGFELRRKRQAIADLPAPANLQALPGTEPGTVELSWAKVPHAKLYRLEYGPVDGPKVEIPLTGRRRKLLAGLDIGIRYAFRIAAIGGRSGQSDWSESIERMVA